ncbi:unnamed protein product [Arabidopsis halleri]
MYQPRSTQRRYETESESRPKKRAKTSVDSGEPDSRKRLEDLEDGFHQQEEMQRPQSHTTQQQQSVQTPQQHQLLASHFNLYPLVENLTDVIEAGTRDQNSDALFLYTKISNHFDKCQQILNSISRSLGSQTNKYVDGQKRNLEESEQLLQQRMELIEEYKKFVEEIVKKEP